MVTYLKELLKEYIDWAKKDNRYPLLFPLIIPLVFLSVQDYFKTRSFAETIHHQVFLIGSGSVVVLSGILFFLLMRKSRKRLAAGGSIAVCGLAAVAYGIFILTPCKLTQDRLVVAVVEFQPEKSAEENDAVTIRNALWVKLQNYEKYGVPILAKKLNKRIVFESPEKGSAAAKKIGKSRRGCAHLVIWGTVERLGSENNDLCIVPYVTVAQNMTSVQIQESQFEGLYDEDVNFHKRTSSEIADVIKFTGGVAYYKTGDWENAIKLFENVELYDAMVMLGMSYLKIGDHPKSLEAFEQALALRPDGISCYNSLGRLHQDMNNYEKSKPYFTRAIELAEEKYKILKKIKLSSPEHREKLETARINFCNVLNNLAISNLKLGEYKRAQVNFEKSLDLNDDPTVHSNLSFCLLELDKINDAIKHWETSLELFAKCRPYLEMEFDVMDAKAGLALGYFTVGKIDQAVDKYTDVVKENYDYSDINKLKNDYFWTPKAILIATQILKNKKSSSQQ